MNTEERIAHHRRMALGYGEAYLQQGVQEGEEYEAWRFAEDAVYTSPYFTGSEVLRLNEVPTDAGEAATLEAKVFALTFPDWKPVDFRYWPAVNGFTMKVRWEGHMADGTVLGFYSYSFVDTDEEGRVSRWETHVDEEYGRFLEVTIGVSGPFHGHSEYVEALRRRLEKAGVAP